MSDEDDYEYDEDGNISLDDVIEDEYEDQASDNDVDWSDNLDDMDSGEWDSQYGQDDDLGEDDIDPWGLN